MKYSFKLFGASLLVVLASCNNKPKVVPGTYVDLNRGESVDVIADPVTGYAINSKTNKPVYLYINNKSDTIFTTGLVVNNKLIRRADGKYEVDGSKVKIDDNQVKINYEDNATTNPVGDEQKIKDGDYKKKVDGDEVKIKDGDYKKKVDGNDVKIKNGDTKIKIEDGEVKKVKK